MIIFCEECGKKYKIDENKIAGEKGRCKCQSCGHIMEIVKSAPDTTAESSSEENNSVKTGNADDGVMEQDTGAAPVEQQTKLPALQGMSLNLKLLINFLGLMALFGGVLTYFYLSFFPSLLAENINARADSVARVGAIALAQPLSMGDDVQVNKIIKDISGLPGVAYVAIPGSDKNFIAGELNRAAGKAFDANGLKGAGRDTGDLQISGQQIHDAAAKIKSSSRKVHVGLYLQQGAMKQDVLDLAPLLIILATLLVLGAISFIILANSISKPIKELAAAAQRISLGELELPIEIKGDGEIRELASSLERMRISIKSAIERLRRR